MQRIIVNGQEVDLEAIAKTTAGKTKQAQPKERRETFTGDVLEISNLHADIDIQPSHKDEITVTVTGPEDVVDRLIIKGKDGAVSISGSKNGNTTIVQNVHAGGLHIGRMITSGNAQVSNIGSIGNFGGVTVISGDDIIINTGDTDDAKLAIKITAPIYTEVNLSGTTGHTTIGNLQGDVDLDLSGQNSITIANVRHLKLDASGACDLIVNEITGSANLDLSGSGKVELRSGYVNKLTVDASGMCKVNAQVIAARANLDASGMCDIRVKAVTGHCHKDRSGMSRIAIG